MDDLPRLFARYRLLLLLCLVVGAGVAIALSYSKTVSYSASASLRIQDITELEGFNGASMPPTDGVPQLAAGVVRTATTDAVLRRAAAILGPPASVSSLRSEVGASVDASSDLVMLSADDSTPSRAARTANALAVATADATNGQARAMFAAFARQLGRRIAQIPNTPANSATRQHDQQNLALLQTLSVVALPTHIAQLADPPTSPTSRRTGFYALLGAVLGLAAGLVFAFAREAFDQKVRRPGQVTSHLDLPILAHLGEPAFAQVSSVDGVDRSDSAQLTLAQFGMLRRNVELLGPDAPGVVLVTSAGPQEGKTTVAAGLALSFARAGRHTALVEADMRRPSLANRLSLDSGPGMSGYLRGEASLVEALEHVDAASSAAGENGAGVSLTCLPAGRAVLAADELLARPRFRDLLRELTDEHDVVVIDAPPVMPVPDALEILPLADAWLLCVRAGRTTVPELGALKETLARLPERSSGAVITGVSKREYRALGYVTERRYAAVAT